VRRSPIVTATLLAALVLTVAGCGNAPQERPIEAAAPAAAPTTADATTTSTPPPTPPPTFPLTGVPLDDLAAGDHPAVVVKIDNTPEARPQSGINEADIVYELLVEGFTRYALVYHSQTPDRVGPVRSARSSDIQLVANLGRPLIAWSGGNPGVTGEVNAAARDGLLVDAGVNVSNDYHRDSSRKAPHNLYTRIPALLGAFAPPDAGPPPALFGHRQPGVPYTGGSEPTAGVLVDFGQGIRAEYVWDAERGGWDRFQVDRRHGRDDSATVDSNGVQVAPQNVVILFLDYGVSAVDARSPLAHSTGEGDAIVLTDGQLIRGRWSRHEGPAGWTLTDGGGNPIDLTPGRTWVALPKNGSNVAVLDPNAAGDLLAARR
jgi:hypothetical protein